MLYQNIRTWKFPLFLLVCCSVQSLSRVHLFATPWTAAHQASLSITSSRQDPVSPSVSLSHQEASISLLSFSIRRQTEWKPQSQKTNQTDHMNHSLSSSMKLWAMPCRANQDGRVMVESSDKTWSTGEENGKPLQYSCLENPMNSTKRQNDRTLKDELPRLVGAQYATGDQWRNNSRKNEETESKRKQHPVVDINGWWK